MFDLDNTLFDSTTIPLEILEPAIAAARNANVAPHAIAADVLEAAIEAARRFGFLTVAERFGTTLELSRFLLTSGFRRMQKGKIATLAELPALIAGQLR